MIKGPPDFENAMHGVYTRAKLEAGYNATVFLQMLHNNGGLGTAKKLINAPHISDGYAELNIRNRIDLTVEALVFDNPKWHGLFTTEEVEKARRRLAEFGYPPK